MTEIWTCEKRFNEAARQSEVVIMGNPKLVSKLQDWLRSSALSQLGSLDTYPELDWSAGK